MTSQMTLEGGVAKEKTDTITKTEGSSKNAIAKGITLLTTAYLTQTLFKERYLEPVADLLQYGVVEVAKLTDQLPIAVMTASPLGDELSNAAVSIAAGGLILYLGAKNIDKYII
ncbi:MAG: hypothetical protein E4G94_01970 [ANME-2 cluster archaeon]|nr:MAG: hypothetical protein E4G94_01970 [ANME-2 cluster archaeon]